MERSFAKATRYGFDHARWRGLGKMKIQEYLTCAIQNIQTLIRHGSKPSKATELRMKLVPAIITKAILPIARPENGLLGDIKADFGLYFQRAWFFESWNITLGSFNSIASSGSVLSQRGFGQQAVNSIQVMITWKQCPHHSPLPSNTSPPSTVPQALPRLKTIPGTQEYLTLQGKDVSSRTKKEY